MLGDIMLQGVFYTYSCFLSIRNEMSTILWEKLKLVTI